MWLARKIGELEFYQKLKEQNHPAKMLAVADHWLRAELDENRRIRRLEKASGSLAHQLDPTDRQGGYASGRGIKLEPVEPEQVPRQGRLSDIMGNAGAMNKHK